MTPPSSSTLLCFIILTSYFVLNCYGQGTRNDLRIARKEMRYGHGHRQAHELGQGVGQSQGLGQGQGLGLDQGQEQRPGLGQGREQGPGQGHGHGHIQGPGQGHGPTQGLGQGKGQTKGPGQEQGQTQGQGRGQSQGQGKKQEEKKENTNENRNEAQGVKIKAMMVFGSSLVDNGNNMFLKTLARPGHLPYGIDFPLGPTGRFSNAKTVIDHFCDLLDLPLLPSFHDPLLKSGKKSIVHGVNFASGGSGIEDLTGVITGQVTSLNKQMDNFQYKIYKALEVSVPSARGKYLRNCLFVIGTGGNDYTFNYFFNPIKLRTLVQYTSKIVNELAVQIKRLYNIGARKFVLMGAYPMGCYPKYRNETSCNDEYNRAAVLFNYQLKALIDNVIPAKWPRSRIVFVDTFNIVMDLIKNPHSRGFKNVKDPCCELKPLAAGVAGVTSLCKKEGNVCKDRNSYVFFDGIHPTNAVNMLIAYKAFFSKRPSEVYPMNLLELSSMNLSEIVTVEEVKLAKLLDG